MKIKGIEGLTIQDLAREIENGGRFVIYRYCFPAIFMTFLRASAIRFVRGHESRVLKGLGYTLVSLLAGWWAVPWGPIYTVSAIVGNFRGGKDVTAAVLASFRQPSAPTEPAAGESGGRP